MAEEKKEDKNFFMLTAETDDNVFANVYDNFSLLKEAYLKYHDKVDVRTWLLTPVKEKEDLVIAKVRGYYVACLGPKKPIEGDKFIKVVRQEIKIKSA